MGPAGTARSRRFRLRALTAWLCLVLALTAGAPAGVQPAVTEGEPAPSLTGRLLVARESLRDPNFAQTVVFMLQHDTEGAMGLVINRPLALAPLGELLEEMGDGGEGLDGEIELHYGGPVEPGRGFLLHSDKTMLDSSQALPGGFALTSDPEMLRRIGEGRGPDGFRFLLGYAGWAPGQLEGEITRGSWWHIEADPQLVFDQDEASIWKRALAARGVDL